MTNWYRFAASVTAMCMALAMLRGGRAEEPAPPPTEEQTITVTEETPENLPEYWLGLTGEPIADALKSQLKIDGGLVIASVVDGSPAAKAGLQQHDVLLQFGGKPVNDLPALIESLRAVNGAETEILVIRGGEKTTLKVSPEKRPTEHAPPAAEDVEIVRQYYRRLGDAADGDRVRLFAVSPGIVFGEATSFPKNTTITIRREDNGPAKIDVKQGDKEWSVTEENLGDLPDDVRASLHHILPSEIRKARVRAVEAVAPPSLPAVRLRVRQLESEPIRVRALTKESDVSAKIDQLMEKIDRLEKKLQALEEKDSQK